MAGCRPRRDPSRPKQGRGRWHRSRQAPNAMRASVRPRTGAQEQHRMTVGQRHCSFAAQCTAAPFREWSPTSDRPLAGRRAHLPDAPVLPGTPAATSAPRGGRGQPGRYHLLLGSPFARRTLPNPPAADGAAGRREPLRCGGGQAVAIRGPSPHPRAEFPKTSSGPPGPRKMPPIPNPGGSGAYPVFPVPGGANAVPIARPFGWFSQVPSVL